MISSSHTAGHVDHGKSSLIRRLTDIDPDRLAEEKRRGLTIELGYAWCTLPSGTEVGFVDVPGHERFVRTMLRASAPCSSCCSSSPPTRDGSRSPRNAASSTCSGSTARSMAVTKRDLVDEARPRPWPGSRTRLRNKRSNARRCSLSSATGEVDELVAALDEMVTDAPDPERDRRPRLFVDRVFPIAAPGRSSPAR